MTTALIAFAIMPLSLWALVHYRRRLETRVGELRQRSADIGSFLIETLQATTLIVSSNAQARESARFRQKVSHLRIFGMFVHEFGEVRPRIREQTVLDEGDRARRSLDIGDDSVDRAHGGCLLLGLCVADGGADGHPFSSGA